MQEKLFTVGHSNHQADFFLELLRGRELQVVVDVRSVPSSRYVSGFNKQRLEETLKLSGFKYLFLGELLGGRPAEQALRDRQGRVDYRQLAATEKFQQGLDRLENGLAAGWRIALMCAEEDPLTCHRHWLIARELELVRRVRVFHLRADGSEMRALDHLAAGPEQLGMFHA
jgi:uncharacterized protein (DUF488 family)